MLPQGYLLPTYHRQYWLGISANPWPYFTYADPSVGAYGTLPNNYTNWGNDTSSNQYPTTAGYDCGSAKYMLAYTPGSTSGPESAWGWMDTLCNETYTSMCRISGE